ncbi:MAG: hypothetical protein AB1454_10960 [Candidatus Auribacterota bacterium]
MASRTLLLVIALSALLATTIIGCTYNEYYHVPPPAVGASGQ